MGKIDTDFISAGATDGAPRRESDLRASLDALTAHQRLLSAEIARLRALSSLGEGVATIAHEIRNPLGAIAGFTELLNRRCESQPELREMATKIVTASHNLNALVQRLLELVRNAPMEVRPIDWTRFLAATIDQYEELSRQRGARLTFVRHWPERIAEGQADALCLRQAVWNVLENAEQASPSHAEIEIEGIPREDGCLLLRIADRGTGIDPSVMEKLFTPFVTTREQGTGLGLSTARKIVEAHGGRIAIRNREGGGAEVDITLPAPGGVSLLLDEGERR